VVVSVLEMTTFNKGHKMIMIFNCFIGIILALTLFLFTYMIISLTINSIQDIKLSIEHYLYCKKINRDEKLTKELKKKLRS